MRLENQEFYIKILNGLFKIRKFVKKIIKNVNKKYKNLYFFIISY